MIIKMILIDNDSIDFYLYQCYWLHILDFNEFFTYVINCHINKYFDMHNELSHECSMVDLDIV